MGEMTMIMKGTRLCKLRSAYCHDWESGADQTMSASKCWRI